MWHLPESHSARGKEKLHGPGSVAWSEHLLAWSDYARRYGTSQSAERLAERGGFGYAELTDHLGHEPTTWEPRRPHDDGSRAGVVAAPFRGQCCDLAQRGHRDGCPVRLREEHEEVEVLVRRAMARAFVAGARHVADAHQPGDLDEENLRAVADAIEAGGDGW